jgi:hypothetical protein
MHKTARRSRSNQSRGALRRLLSSALCLALAPLLVAQQISNTPAKQADVNSPVSPSKQKDGFILPKNTEITLVLLEDLSSATANHGQTVRMAVWKDVIVDGVVVIPRATPATDVVEEVIEPIPGKRDGDIWVKPVSITLPDNSQIPLRDYAWTSADDGVCSGFSCAILYVAGFPFLIGELIAAPFQNKHGTGKVRRLPVCSIQWSEPSRKIFLHPVGTRSAQSSAPSTDLKTTCPVEDRTFINMN